MEEKKASQRHEPLNLEKAYTFFIVPFYYEGDWDDILKCISRWRPQQEEMYKEDILYPYIMELFRQANPNKNSPTNRLKIYQLHTKDKGSKSDFFFDRILGKKNVAIVENMPTGDKNPYPIPFSFLNEGNNAPHLFISPTAKIGVMTLCAELESGCSIQDLQTLNYYLHKRNEIATIVVGEKEMSDGKKKEIKDKRTTNYRIICPSPETNKALSYEDIKNSVNQYLNTDEYKQLINEVQNINDEHINWDLNYFIGFLLNTLGCKSQIKYFNKERIHIYTFCSIDDTGSKKETIISDGIIPEALRLSRVVNNKYLLPFDTMVQKGAILQTYQNIYFSSAIEGTSMICIEKDINKSFIGDMQNMFNRQYLLVYLLVLLQRYTLLSIDRRLTEYDARNDDTDEELWRLIKLICKIKVNCYYTDVSVYTHHSQFYQHCCKNLHIPETFEEIDGKVELLKLTTDRKMQTLMKAQNDNQEKAKEETEHRQHILNWVVAILTIAQVIQASYDIFCHKDELPMWYSLGVGAIGIIFLVWLMWKDIGNFIKKK